MKDVIPPQYLQELSAHALQADENRTWPAESWQILTQLGGLRWSIPREYGGEDLASKDLLERNETLAGACLTTCFLLSQRDAACRRLHGSDNTDLTKRLFPALLSGERFITVGLAQLTTSRQFGKPAFVARRDGNDWILNGVIPWVTGASQASDIVTGAVTEDGKQILLVLPTSLSGVVIEPALDLAALQGSMTGPIHCNQVRVPADQVLAGPADHVMRSERGGTGGLETSSLALGLAGTAIRYMQTEVQRRTELSSTAKKLEDSLTKLRDEMYVLAERTASPEQAQGLRARANSLVLRSTQAALAVSKGTGFVKTHPVQMWARQGLFFLVWSCPWPVTEATLAFLTDKDSSGTPTFS